MPDKLIQISSNPPEVSVIIVTHNRTERLKRCIKTILLNTVLPKELVIVDDSDRRKDCKDSINSLKIKSPKVRFIYRRVYPKKGVSYSRNLGIVNSTGNIIAFIDDDCDASISWVERMTQSHSLHKDAMAITGFVEPRYPQNYWNKVLFQFHKDEAQKVKETDFLFGANYSFKREVFDKHKLYFNNKMHCFSEDTYISFKLQREGFKLLYDPNIKVKHDFRTGTWEVIKRWFTFGISDYYFWKLTPNYHTKDADYFRKGSTVNKLLKAPFRAPPRVFKHISNLNGWGDKMLIPGLALIFFCYFIGVYTGLTKDMLNTKSISQYRPNAV